MKVRPSVYLTNSFVRCGRLLYSSCVANLISVRSTRGRDHGAGWAQRMFGGRTDVDLQRSLGRFLRPGDRLDYLASNHCTEILVERNEFRSRAVQLLYATIGYATLPKERKDGSGYFVHADLPNCLTGPQALFLSGDAIRRYFYLPNADRDRQTLYDRLRTSDSVTLAGLRVAWRVT